MKEYLISVSSSLRKCLQHMDDMQIKFMIAVDDKKRVIGTLTDGDIRRSLLRGETLETSLSNTVHHNFTYVTHKAELSDVLDLFQSENFDFIPVLNQENVCVNIITRRGLQAYLLKNNDFQIDYRYTTIDEKSFDYEIFNRPWGFYKTVILNEKYQAKVIHVSPTEKLSLQSHQHREEHWIVVSGEGTVQIGESILAVTSGSNFFIPKGCKHRLVNDSEEQVMILVEVQLGDYFGEDDIKRYEDEYGRGQD